MALAAIPLIAVPSVDREGSPDDLPTLRRCANRQETPRVHGTRCRCPPAKQRVPFVRGCVPEVSGPSHETGRVRLLDQRQALTTATPCNSPRVVIPPRRRLPPSAAFPFTPAFAAPTHHARQAIGRSPRADFGSPMHAKPPNLHPMRADLRQHHAQAASVFKAAARFFRVDRSSPLRIAPADDRHVLATMLRSTPRESASSRRDVALPIPS